MNITGIQFRLLLVGIVPTLLLVVTLALFFIQYHYVDLENALKEKGQITINQLALSSIYGVFSGNSIVLNDITVALLNEPDIASVSVLDRSGLILAHSEQPSLPAKDKLIYFQHPVTIHTIKQTKNLLNEIAVHHNSKKITKTIGTVKIAISLVDTHFKQQNYLVNSLLITFIGIICTILLAIKLSKTISLPIINLTNTANDLANGNMSTRAPECSISEIDDLCQSFNSMAIALQQTQNYLIHQVEAAVKKLNITMASLEEKNKSLEKSTQLAITQNKSKSQFLAHISHEIRTPMNGIMGFSELLTKSELSSQQLDQAQLIKTSATSLLTIVNEILEFSILETGNFNINTSSFNIRENIESCITIITPTSKNVQIIIDVDNNIPTQVSTDPIRLQQVITNLLGNACKFTDQGHIIIRFRMLKPNILFITISDTGIGIKSDKIIKLFQPYLQSSDYALANSQGTGLGLTISKNIIERLNGSIGFCSQYHTGSTFWVNLPISNPETKKTNLKQQSIFVIDPFKLRRLALAKQLTNLGYQTISLASADEFNQKNRSHCDVLFYATNNSHYNLESLPKQIQPVPVASIIFISSHKTLLSINSISLPCRSGYLNRIIESITTTKQVETHPQIPKRTDLYSVFIADDNEINRLLLKAQLERYCKNITLAEDGEVALSFLQQNKYDLILLDLQMPYFSGLELIKKIKLTDSINKNSPFIAITAHAHSQQRKILIDAGFDECLIKPILMDQLQEILELWLPETQITSWENEFDYLHAMLEKTSGNKTLAANIFNILFVELQQQLMSIEQAIATNNFSAAEEITHKLHGSVSFCGFTDVQALAKDLESNLLENNVQLINSNYLSLKNKIIAFKESEKNIMDKLEQL